MRVRAPDAGLTQQSLARINTRTVGHSFFHPSCTSRTVLPPVMTILPL